MKNIFLVLALTFTGIAANAQNFDGLYQPDISAANWSCQESQIGMDGGALAIRGGFLYGVESRCALGNPRPITGMDAVQYTTICSAEGNKYTEEILISRTARGVSINTPSRVMNWRTCETAAPVAAGAWIFTDAGAGISNGLTTLNIACTSGSIPTARLTGYSSASATNIVFSVDGQRGETFAFRQSSDGQSLYSTLYNEIFWDGGIIEAMAAGRSLTISENWGNGNVGNVVTFSLQGSREALDFLWRVCN
ncbi:MAG: hypothetical protein L3J33_11580 [Rhodobacteraceae bacterium]|nr:hypothetical protein [Paracoccaceae bacterium]